MGNEVIETLEKRTDVYVCRPKAYEIAGCVCGNDDPDWSEYKRHLWCAKCQIDFVPAHGGIFDGPIPVNAMRLMGVPVDMYCIATGEIERAEDLFKEPAHVERSEAGSATRPEEANQDLERG